MSLKFDKQAAYDDGYAHGHLSDEELTEMGHTRESFINHIEDTYALDVYDTRLTTEEHESYWGLLDGARDLRRR